MTFYDIACYAIVSSVDTDVGEIPGVIFQVNCGGKADSMREG